MPGTRLAGKVAIITGATGGIGEATARRSLQEGARVMLVGRSAEKLAATGGRLGEFGETASCVAGVVGPREMSPYNASKHAVNGLVRTAAIELATSGIRANAIGPGPIDNRMIRSLEEQMMPDDPDGIRAAVMAGIAMNRYGTNEEVANLALFLASDESSYCTGGIHMIDGGYTAA